MNTSLTLSAAEDSPRYFRFHLPHRHLSSVFGNDWFALKAEAFARFFGTPVFGDFLGFMGRQGPATPATTWTLVFVGSMALIVAGGCYLIFRRWNEWRRNILQKRRNWLG